MVDVAEVVLDFFAVDVVVVVGVVSGLLELWFVLELLTIISSATTTAISAKGARKRAGLLLVRFPMATGW